MDARLLPLLLLAAVAPLPSTAGDGRRGPTDDAHRGAARWASTAGKGALDGAAWSPPVAPSGARHWRVETAAGPLHVWAPAGYDPASADVVVYAHGYNTDVDEAWTRYDLAAQFRASGRNALFLAPMSPRGPRDPVRWASPSAIVAAATRAGVPPPAGDVVLVGHSGAYRSLARWVGDRRVRAAVLLDAFYGADAAFRAFVGRGGRLVIVSGLTLAHAERFADGLPGVVRLSEVPDSIAQFARARVLHVATRLGHAEIVASGRVLPVVLRPERAEGGQRSP